MGSRHIIANKPGERDVDVGQVRFAGVLDSVIAYAAD
jgi:hypothetical protein